MTTRREHPATASAETRTLRADDPAELLAQVRVLMRDQPRDCLALVGHRSRREVLVCARLPLSRVLADASVPGLRRLLEDLVRVGCTGAFGLVVLGDGYQELDGADPAHEGLEGACALATALLEAARSARAAPDPPGAEGSRHPAGTEHFDLREVWVIAEGTARSHRREGTGPVRTLGEAGSTLVEAQSVLAGEALVASRPGPDPVVGALRAALLTREADGPGPRLPVDPDAAWRRALAVIERLERADDAHRGPGDHAPSRVTQCEPVAELLLALASPGIRDRFLALLVARGQGRTLRGPEDVVALMARPDSAPHESIRAGGAWYRAISRILAASRPPAPGEDGALAAGWANLATVLALCAWWNRRSATAGALAEEVLAHDPDHELARLVALMADLPVRPHRPPAARDR